MVCYSLRFQLLALVESPAKIVGYLSRNAGDFAMMRKNSITWVCCDLLFLLRFLCKCFYTKGVTPQGWGNQAVSCVHGKHAKARNRLCLSHSIVFNQTEYTVQVITALRLR